MTITNQTSYVRVEADGTQTAFTFDFPFIDDEDVKVYADEVLVAPTGYSLVPEPDNIGGTITFSLAPVNGTIVMISRETPFTQETDYPPYGPFKAESHEAALDKLTMLVQQVNNSVDVTLEQSFHFKGDWMATTDYLKTDIVIYGGNYYSAKYDFTSGGAFDAGNWYLMLDLTDFWAAVALTEDYADQAEQFAAEAATYAQQAANCNQAAYEWAQWPVDTLVPNGNMVDEYSAYNWATKAINTQFWQAGPGAGQIQYLNPGSMLLEQAANTQGAGIRMKGLAPQDKLLDIGIDATGNGHIAPEAGFMVQAGLGCQLYSTNGWNLLDSNFGLRIRRLAGNTRWQLEPNTGVVTQYQQGDDAALVIDYGGDELRLAMGATKGGQLIAANGGMYIQAAAGDFGIQGSNDLYYTFDGSTYWRNGLPATLMTLSPDGDLGLGVAPDNAGVGWRKLRVGDTGGGVLEVLQSADPWIIGRLYPEGTELVLGVQQDTNILFKTANTITRMAVGKKQTWHASGFGPQAGSDTAYNYGYLTQYDAAGAFGWSVEVQHLELQLIGDLSWNTMGGTYDKVGWKYTALFTQNTSGGHVITWNDATIKWDRGIEPDMPPAAGASMLVEFRRVDLHGSPAWLGRMLWRDAD